MNISEKTCWTVSMASWGFLWFDCLMKALQNQLTELVSTSYTCHLNELPADLHAAQVMSYVTWLSRY